jgi:hypothetical protein
MYIFVGLLPELNFGRYHLIYRRLKYHLNFYRMASVRLWNSAGASDSGFNAVAHIAEKKVFVAGDEEGCIHFFSGIFFHFVQNLILFRQWEQIAVHEYI